MLSRHARLSLASVALLVSVGCSSSDDSAAAGSGGGSSGQGGSAAGAAGASLAGSGGSAGSTASGGSGAGGSAAPGSLSLTTPSTPGACDFGALTLGQLGTTCVVTVKNTGGTTVTFPSSSVSITGDDPTTPSFVVVTPPAGSLAAGASTTLSVTFAPQAEGARTATLTVASSAKQAPTIALKGGATCPTKAPADLDNPVVRDHCTETTYLAVGGRTRRLVSHDLQTWSHDQIDRINCLTNADGTLNCGNDEGSYLCSKRDPKDCKDIGGDALDCTIPDQGDPTKRHCGGFDDGSASAAFGKGLIVTASQFGIFTSADAGTTWTKAPPPVPQQWGQGLGSVQSAFGNGVFLVISDDKTFSSSDGTTWTRYSDNQLGGFHFNDFAYGGGHFVTSGDGGTKVTEDGSSWHDHSDLQLNKIAYGNGLFVGVGNGFRVTSKDGTNWQKISDACPTDQDPNGWSGPHEQCPGNTRTVLWDGKRFLACGVFCIQSTDGVTWTGVDSVHFTYGNPNEYMSFLAGKYFGGGWDGTWVKWTTDIQGWDQWSGQTFPKDTVGAGQYVQRVSAGLTLKGAGSP